MDVILLIDNSWSMSHGDTVTGAPPSDPDGLRISAAKFLVDYLRANAEALGVNYRVGVVSFGGVVSDVIPLRLLQDNTVRDGIHAEVIRFTDFYSPLQFALQEFKAKSLGTENKMAVILFTDGHPNLTDAEMTEEELRAYFEDLASPVGELEEVEVPLFLLGIGDTQKYKDHWTRLIPSKHYISITSTAELLDVYNGIVADLIGPAGAKCKWETIPAGRVASIEVEPYRERVVFSFIKSDPAIHIILISPAGSVLEPTIGGTDDVHYAVYRVTNPDVGKWGALWEGEGEVQYCKAAFPLLPVPTPTLGPTVTPTSTPTPTSTATPSPTPSPSSTFTPMPPTVTLSPMPTPTLTPSPMPTSTPTFTSTPMPIPTRALTPTATATPDESILGITGANRNLGAGVLLGFLVFILALLFVVAPRRIATPVVLKAGKLAKLYGRTRQSDGDKLPVTEMVQTSMDLTHEVRTLFGKCFGDPAVAEIMFAAGYSIRALTARICDLEHASPDLDPLSRVVAAAFSTVWNRPDMYRYAFRMLDIILCQSPNKDVTKHFLEQMRNQVGLPNDMKRCVAFFERWTGEKITSNNIVSFLDEATNVTPTGPTLHGLSNYDIIGNEWLGMFQALKRSNSATSFADAVQHLQGIQMSFQHFEGLMWALEKLNGLASSGTPGTPRFNQLNTEAREAIDGLSQFQKEIILAIFRRDAWRPHLH